MTAHTRRPIPSAASDGWMALGTCREVDPDLFFPERSNADDVENAKAVCTSGCPVREACLQWALETGQDHGVWGGLSHDERRSLKRKASRRPMPVRPSTAWERLQENAEQVAAWKAEGVAGLEIAKRLEIGSDTVYRWLRATAVVAAVTELEVAA